MSKRYSPDLKKKKKKKAIMVCVRETPHIKMKAAWDLKEKLSRLKKKKHGKCKTNSPQKNKASIGSVRETPKIKIRTARSV